jgi:hypothetical protein
MFCIAMFSDGALGAVVIQSRLEKSVRQLFILLLYVASTAAWNHAFRSRTGL